MPYVCKHFVKGFFNVSMRALRPQVGALAIMRLDGDMYQSTVDVLYNFYDKLSIGGYVIIDDWGLPAEAASRDFLRVHGVSPQIVRIDYSSVYWMFFGLLKNDFSS